MSSLAPRTVRNLAVLLPVVAIDQGSKWLVAATLARGEVTEFLPFVGLRLGFNKGVSFGLFPAGSAAGVGGLILMTTLIVILLSAWSLVTRNAREGMALSLVVGGAVGNIIDRVRVGMVTDFIDLNAAGYHWPAFNLADAAIVMGIVWLLLQDRRPAAWPAEFADVVSRRSSET